LKRHMMYEYSLNCSCSLNVDIQKISAFCRMYVDSSFCFVSVLFLFCFSSISVMLLFCFCSVSVLFLFCFCFVFVSLVWTWPYMLVRLFITWFCENLFR
jgi:hypothetical protein